ncbi:MAG: two-component regulator propeller domain-containing protein [bacterium]|nr:two-component regulator propeller domain-containing protein [bacterium]
MKKSGFKLFVFSFLLALLALIPACLEAQNFMASPLIKNYPKQVYNGGTQTWDICDGPNGLIFFANNNGLLLFDGKDFSNFPLPKHTILRSIYYDSKKQRVYAGGQNEIGYYQIAANGNIQFYTLAKLLPENYKGFEDIWGIEAQNDKIIFQTSRQIFVYDGNQIITLKPSENLLENLHKVNNKLLLSDASGSIFEYKFDSFKPILLHSNLDISAILEYNPNTYFITTYKNGIYLLQNGSLQKAPFNQEQIQQSRIYRACKYGSQFVLATNRGGVYFLDSNGMVLNQISVQDGLQNNNVLSILQDENKNVWLGLDNGIDLIRLNYPFGYLYPDGILKGTGYAMTQYGNTYYFATNNGLYARSVTSGSSVSFQLVQNTEGQVWWVQEINGKLFACHHEGLFLINELTAQKISDTRGCWKIIPLKKNPGYFALGTYNGINIFKWENGTLNFVSKPGPFKESSRFLEEDNAGNIWVGHPYKGLYKIGLNQSLQGITSVSLYGTNKGLPAETENYVFNTDLGICFATTKGIYQYDADLDRFKLFQSLQQWLDTGLVYKRIFQGKNGRIWYIASNEIGYLNPSYNGVEYAYKKIKLPKLDQNLVGGFEFMAECQNQHIFLGVETGFVQINLQKISRFKQDPPRVIATGISSLVEPDSFYYKYVGMGSDKLFFNDRSIEFSFSSPNSHFFNDLNFSSYLEGWDKSWSAWKPNITREFSQLGYGDYTLRVKGRCMGLEGPETKIYLRILAPWYWTTAAKLIYSLMAVLLVLVIGFYPQMLVRKKAIRIIAEKDDYHKKQTEQLRLEKEKQEMELVELKNQQLQKEVDHQGKELASSTMHLVQKSEMLLSIKDKLKHISSISNDPKIKPEISELIKNIEKDTLIDKDWEKFELYFNNIHHSYTKSLKAQFPVLTANDIKMCAYLRMNLSTKEIASILNISARGVEISRYRLRKKMSLENGINLTDYLSKIS